MHITLSTRYLHKSLLLDVVTQASHIRSCLDLISHMAGNQQLASQGRQTFEPRDTPARSIATTTRTRKLDQRTITRCPSRENQSPPSPSQNPDSGSSKCECDRCLTRLALNPIETPNQIQPRLA